VVMKAMVLLARDERLKELGWKMLLQIHDELILEGPEVSKDEAMGIQTGNNKQIIKTIVKWNGEKMSKIKRRVIEKKVREEERGGGGGGGEI
jgi:DNA polymerase I-like protein with 3'-5' exonuclease and polymerase domains